MLLDDTDYEWAPHRWLALRDREPLGVKVRGKLSSRLLAQELVCEEWQVFVACMLLNRTRREQAHLALWRVLWRYPTASKLARAHEWDLRPLIRHCGFADRRAEGLIRMASDLLAGERHPFGIGNYAWESHLIFTHGENNIEPEDHELRAYLVEMRPPKKIDRSNLAKKRAKGISSTNAVQMRPARGRPGLG